MSQKLNTIYITRNGLMEPLGQSQVFSYLRGLSTFYRITLITYEKDCDWVDRIRVGLLRNECDRMGIHWLPQRFITGPKLIAPALGMLSMAWLLAREVVRQGARLIHARSYIPAAVAMAVGRITGVPFIFDMRALWPEELITAGRIRRGSITHKIIVAAERSCLHRAAAVVTLTHASVNYLQHEYPDDLRGQRIVVIPTCADLERFVPMRQRNTPLIVGCLGTLLSGWFRLDWLAAFFSVAARHDPALRFEVTTRDNPELVLSGIKGDADLKARLSIAPCASEQVHELLQRQMVSVMFYAGGEISELGRSPTRLAEILGCGVPVVANEGIGDVALIIRKYRVGILVKSEKEADMEQAFEELKQLLNESDLADRCRRAAEEVFSLEMGTQKYALLYASILNMSTHN